MRSDDGGMSGAVGADDQREVGNVTGRKAASSVIVVATVRIEMWAGGFEVGAVALGELMDVERMLAWRKIFNIELDANAVRSLGKRCGADDLIFSVSDVNGERFCRGCRRRSVGDGYRCRKKEAEKCRESLHRTSLDWTADTGSLARI